MARQTGEIGIVRIIRMALAAKSPPSLVPARINFEVLRVVIERGGNPRGRRVARLARLAEIERGVIGVRRSGVIGLVALVAARIRHLVIVVDVARGARRRRVFPRQGEIRGGVIVRSACPVRRRMACFARPAEVQRRMIGIRRAGEVRIVALIAAGVREVVISVLVA